MSGTAEGGGAGSAHDVFGMPSADSGPVFTPIPAVKPPVIWLGLSAVSALVGGFVGWFFGVRLFPALIGWFLAGPVAIGLLGRYVWLDTVRRAQPTRIDYPWAAPAYHACLALAILASAIVATVIALWFGRGGTVL
ncbi:MAG TPA: hypothetical protein VIT65_02895 [Microlunatus sp.]